jgi:hypothetical protein
MNVFSVLGLVTSKGGKRQAAIGMDALKEIFLARYIVSKDICSVQCFSSTTVNLFATVFLVLESLDCISYLCCHFLLLVEHDS